LRIANFTNEIYVKLFQFDCNLDEIQLLHDETDKKRAALKNKAARIRVLFLQIFI